MRLNISKLLAVGFVALAGVSFGVAASHNHEGVSVTDNKVAKTSVYSIYTTLSNKQNINIEGKIVSYLGNGLYEFADLDGTKIQLKLDNAFDWSQIKKDELVTLNADVVKEFVTPQLIGRSAFASNR